ncbi:GNAT family N-acetyltransferase [Stutzerimonas kunmingensis]|uniref:GNAT family N-acetyltransferase n=1 Tax=Stutzerimonas kunmingensis TaxID=1211807 RepID=UPI00241D0665|nr:GNAT family N-acetyltransferase [Stutzerimonas kunmingensis]
MKVIRYEATSHRDQWDTAVQMARNGMFMFERAYMDYHSARFEDCSLLFYDSNQRLKALLPANRQDTILHSHAGLTFGGLLLMPDVSQTDVLSAFEVLLEAMPGFGVDELRYKCLPGIYHKLPSEDDRYALYRLGAERYRCDPSSCLAPVNVNLSSRRRRGREKAIKAGFDVRECLDWQAFWQILEANLAERHFVQPAHSQSEIVLLASRFPKAIRLFGCFREEQLMAGAVIYDSGQVAHAQYIASTFEGRKYGALDILFSALLETNFANHSWFDFGISSEQQGWRLNEGLISFKEGFGARTIVHEFYCLKRD